MPDMNCYEILEVSPNASPAVIKAAFKSLMQRYHPDRNPGDAQIAEHASQVVQAYEVLSDPAKRAAYDMTLSQQPAAPQVASRDNQREVRYAVAPEEDQHRNLYWIVWTLIGLTMAASMLVLFLTRSQPVPEPAAIQQATVASAASDEARTLPLFLVRLNINLLTLKKPSADAGNTPDAAQEIWEDSGNVLAIPVLGVKVGTFDSLKVIRHLEANETYIRQKLEKKLAKADYDELAKIGGEQYLKNMILDAIDEASGTNRHEDYPPSPGESPGRYGVIEALLPESFTVSKIGGTRDSTP
ncbi:MAG: J domain-containing protein [Sideroxydans sp.]|nr:J domain-containing protein [Sideroxydans sp.]